MTRLKPTVIIGLLFILLFLALKFNFSLLYPYYYLKDLILTPVLAGVESDNILLSNESYESIIASLQSEIVELKKLNNIKTVLSEFNKINATIIGRNKEYWFNTITIDKGKKDGVKADFAVIDNDGLIGRVENVREYTSDVKLISSIDKNNKISVVIHNDNKDYYGLLTDFDTKNKLLIITLFEEGDIMDNAKVETTGLGGIFPKGILIGEVYDSYKESDDVTYIVRVKAKSNLEGDRYVSVLQREEVSNS